MNIEPGFSAERSDYVDLPAEDANRARRKRWIIIGAGIVIALLAAYLLLRGGEKPVDAGQAPPLVTVITPGRQMVTSVISATGNLAARREMPVGVAGEGGMIARVLVEPGDWVAAGQVLATIDSAVQAQQTNQMAAQIAVAQADARIAESDLDRAQKLVARGFVSKADLDRRLATRDAALARFKLSQAQFGEMKARVARLDIRAPAAGLVLARAVEPGQIVGPSNGALFRLARDGQMELLARLAEQDLARLAIGVSADVVPVGSTRAFRGSIWQLSPIIDPQTRQGVARIALAYDPALRPGGFAAVKIVSGSVDAPLLPESAVQTDDSGAFVLIVGKGDVVARRDVKIGDVSDRGVAILSGLSGGERIVLSAGAFLSPGDKIIPELRRADR